LFVELAIQIYLRKIDLGILEIINEDARESIEILRSNLDQFVSQEREDNENFISKNEKYIEDLLTDLSEQIIKETISSFRSSFSSRNTTLDQFVLGPMIDGEVRGVVVDPKISEDFPEIVPTFDISTMKYSDLNYAKTRIIMEKYIIIEDKENVPASLRNDILKRKSNLFGVVNLDTWGKYLDSHKVDFASYDIGDLWSGWKFGLRLSYVMPELSENISEEDRQNNKAYEVTFNGTKAGLIPLVEITKDIENQKVTPDIVNDYDISCLIYDLSQDVKYKKLFREAVDIETLISLLTIYSVDNYELFLGSGTKSKSDLNKWQKNPEFFTDTKKSIINIIKEFK